MDQLHLNQLTQIFIVFERIGIKEEDHLLILHQVGTLGKYFRVSQRIIAFGPMALLGAILIIKNK